jgi:hypothetical protein
MVRVEHHMGFEFWALLTGAVAALLAILAARDRYWRAAVLGSAILVLVVAAAIVAAIVTDGDDNQQNTSAPEATVTPDAREVAYSKLSELRAGLSLQHFEDVLGTPLFVTPSSDGQFTQSLFRGSEYWLQTISDLAGAVQLMAITSCTPNFRPRFEGIRNAEPAFDVVVLHETELDQTGAAPSRVHYFTSGATANSFYFDEYYFGNPGNYKTYFVGINDACGFDFSDPVYELFITAADYREKAFDPTDDLVRTFRSRAVANTYAETAPFATNEALASFQIGADRILTRTAPAPGQLNQ